MRNTIKWLALAALAIPAAGCVESADQAYGYNDGYYAPSYSGGYSSGYTPSSGYYATPSVNNYYYSPAPTVVTQTRYVPVPVAQSAPQHRLRDSDHDGIPDRYDRDKNGDGIPDRYQRQSSR